MRFLALNRVDSGALSEDRRNMGIGAIAATADQRHAQQHIGRRRTSALVPVTDSPPIPAAIVLMKFRLCILLLSS